MDLVEAWAVLPRRRDVGPRFRDLWHDDGVMMATWTQGTANAFIAMNRAGWDKGLSILHFLGGHVSTVSGDRATTQTKMTISQRADVSRRGRSMWSAPGVFFRFLGASFGPLGAVPAPADLREGTGWIPSTRRPHRRLIPRRSALSPKDIATWPICRPSWAIR